MESQVWKPSLLEKLAVQSGRKSFPRLSPRAREHEGIFFGLPLPPNTVSSDSGLTTLLEREWLGYTYRDACAMDKIRVLLADDHDTIVAQVRTVLDEEFEVVGAVNNGLAAVAEVRRLDPDVLVIDVSMPGLDGLEATYQVHSSRRTEIVFLTVHQDEDFVAAAFDAGASAYVTKADVETDLIPAIHEALDGRIFISKSISG